ncbi:zinc finger matrin-type protein 4-like [Styela clava]|uniref:zinc finger matrin-type protein 1-like n=1 Tax=Styela clava TaxID=7725 RepID=UPI00193A7604|nr:zinc finger matrin-type protein 1-like [Styela clava]
MAYLIPDDPNEDPYDFTANYWMTKTGPFGVSGFCMDGMEMGNYCYLCETHSSSYSQVNAHFEGRKHAQKVKACCQTKTKFIVEPSTGGDLNDPDNLFLPDRCKVCDAELSTPEQQEGHYMSEKHQKKVRNYFLVKIGIREKNVKLDPEENEEELKKKSKLEYCAICKVELSAPVVAQSHYAGKKHAKKLREKFESDADGTQWQRCDVCDVRLNSEAQLTQHLQSSKHLAKIDKMGTEWKEETRKNVTKRKEEIEVLLKEEEAKRECLAQELDEMKKLEELHS